MGKLLYLVHRIPYPPNKGDKIRSFHFLKAIAEQYEVHLGAFIDDANDKPYVEQLRLFCKQVFCLDLNSSFAKIKSMQGLANGEALSLPYYRDARMQAWVDRTIAEQGIQQALIFSSPMAQYLQKHGSVRLVADFVDVDSDKWRQYAESKSWPASWVYRREAEKLLDFERRIAAHAAQTLFVSEREAALFKTLAPESAANIGFVNNGVDTGFFDPDQDVGSPYPAGIKAIAFTGAMDYWANVDAVKWFAEQVMPRINATDPDARFYIVGSKPAKAVLQLGDNNASVIVTGRVDDVRTYLAHAHVVVAPLRIARGIQNKVLEAMAMARPVVVTPAAMEGIPGSAELQAPVVDSPEDFAEAVSAVLQGPFARAPQNRAYVLREFGWQRNGEKLCRLLGGEAA